MALQCTHVRYAGSINLLKPLLAIRPILLCHDLVPTLVEVG
jgi:hypothetical protein